MSAMMTMEGVNTLVIILMAVSCVHATLDINYILTNFVQVCAHQ